MVLQNKVLTKAFVFPGQGSQKVGMADAFLKNFKTARNVIDEIEDAISRKIKTVMEEGPLEELTKTNNAQIAIFSTSIAIFSVLTTDFGFNTKEIAYMAGHSLGEYSAIYAAGSLPLGMAAKLVSDRGNIMASYSGSKYHDPNQKLGMAAVLGLPYEKLREIVTKDCVIANDNSDSQVVISGLQSEIEIVSNRAMAIGAKKIIELNTAGAFHSHFMMEANRRFIEETLSKISLSNPSIPIIMNAIAAPVSDTDGMYKSLALQMVNPVMWRSTIDCMAKFGIGSIIEIGAGKVLTDISKRSHPDIKMLCLGTIADIEEFVKDEQQQ